MSSFQELIEQTEVLRTRPTMTGTEGRADYFEILTEGNVRVALKVSISPTANPQPFARIRIMKSSELEIFPINTWVDGLDMKKVGKAMAGKGIKAINFQANKSRASYLVVSEKGIQDFGDFTSIAGWDEVQANLSSTFANIGNRVYESLGQFFKTKDRHRVLIQSMMADYATLLSPPKPDGYVNTEAGEISDNVVDIIGKAQNPIDKILGKANEDAKKTLEDEGIVPKSATKAVDDILIEGKDGKLTSVKGTEMGDAALKNLNEALEPPTKKKKPAAKKPAPKK